VPTYALDFTQTTPKGIKVDSTNQNVNLALIDKQVDEVEACLGRVFGNPPIIPESLIGDFTLPLTFDIFSLPKRSPTTKNYGKCIHNTFELPIPRQCIFVKIPDDWDFSCLRDNSQEVLNVPAENWVCEMKGLTPTKGCPCKYRVAIAQNNVIVVTPSMYMLKDALIRIITGCTNPWVSPLSQCASPSVPELSGLTPEKGK
jgi:hypothetical protein